jgi:glycosyltransferase involved in cell wall biosynthesis
MRIRFYAPLKPPGHDVVSGDRQMARLLVKALARAGHEVVIASELRIHLKTGDPQTEADLRRAAAMEQNRLLQIWASEPDRATELWFTYHPYYKSPDWLGPPIARVLSIPYVTAEASWAGKRANGPWANAQRDVADGLHQAAVNFCLTARDREGLEEVLGSTSTLVDLPPFIDLSGFSPPLRRKSARVRLLAVAMMRNDVKLESYRFLAGALEKLPRTGWELEVVGDGEARSAVEIAFSNLPAGQIIWTGKCPSEILAARYGRADFFVWPGIGEAYGMAYLEAQAVGLPVIALDTAGVPAVVKNQVSGILTPPGDEAAYAGAITELIENATLRQQMGAVAAAYVHANHSLESATALIDSEIKRHDP